MSGRDSAGDIFVALGIFFIGLGLLIFVSLTAAVIWWVVASILEHFRRKYLEQKAAESFVQVAAEEGVDLPGDDMFNALVGAGIEPPSDGGYDNYIDLLEGSFLGTGVSYDN